MKLIVTDMDGTLLNSKRRISAENAAALLAASKFGIEVAIATGRTYGNALRLCRSVGLEPHIISNHGAFVYTSTGRKIMSVELERNYLQDAVTWLANNSYYYNICTDTHSYMPAGSDLVLLNDFKTAKSVIPGVTETAVTAFLQYLRGATEDKIEITSLDDIFAQDLNYGSILAISFCNDKLRAGRDYFGNFAGLSMTVAGRNVFELVHPSVSKGKALEHLADHLQIPMDQIMAFGDNYNDISMLERVGISVAVENAEAEVKRICSHVTLSNELNGVACCINEYLQR